MVTKSFAQATLLTTDNTIALASLSSDIVLGPGEYNTVDDLPLSNNKVGDQAFVRSTSRLYIWSGQGWYSVALINTSPAFDSGGLPDASYELDSNQGLATVIQLSATDPEGLPIQWSYLTSDSAQYFADITNDSSVFTITAKPTATIQQYDSMGGSFSITFKASDGINLATALSEFTISFSLPSYGINVRTSAGKVTLGMTTPSLSGGGLTADGSNLYIVGYDGDQYFYRWELGTPYELRTIPLSYTERSGTLNANVPTGFYIKPDGTRAFWIGNYGTIYWATMSTPNNMSTFGSVSSATSLVPSGLIFGMTFKHDGTSFYIAGTNGDIYQHDVSTPWDPSTKTTGSSGSGTFDPSGVQYPFGMFFNYSGTKLFLGSSNSTIYEHNLSTPWQLSSAINPPVATFSLSTVQSTPLYDLVGSGSETRGIFLSTDETKLYLFVRGGNVIELVLNTPGTLIDGVEL
jgi:hypothetical protein